MKKLFYDLSTSTVAKGVLVVSTLALSWVLPRLLSVEGVGQYYFLLNTVAFFGLTGTLAIEDHALSVVSRTEGRERSERLGAIVGVTLLAVVVLSPLLAGGFVVLEGSPWDDPGIGIGVLGIGLWTLTIGLQRVFGESIRAKGDIQAAVVLGVRSRFGSPATSGVLVLLLAALYLAGRETHLWGVIWVSLGVSAAATLVSTKLVTGGIDDLRSVLRGIRKMGTILRSSVGYLGAKVGTFLSRYVDIWIAGFLLSSEDVGVYAVAATLAGSVNLPMAMTNDIVPNLIGEHIGAGSRPELEAKLRGLAGLALLAGLVGVVGFALLGGQILDLVYGPEYVAGYPVLVILGAAYLTSPLAGSAGLVLIVDGQRRALIKSTWMGVLVFVGAGVAGTEYFGSTGLAVAALFAHATMQFAKAYYSKQVSGVLTVADPRRGIAGIREWLS